MMKCPIIVLFYTRTSCVVSHHFPVKFPVLPANIDWSSFLCVFPSTLHESLRCNDAKFGL